MYLQVGKSDGRTPMPKDYIRKGAMSLEKVFASNYCMFRILVRKMEQT